MSERKPCRPQPFTVNMFMLIYFLCSNFFASLLNSFLAQIFPDQMDYLFWFPIFMYVIIYGAAIAIYGGVSRLPASSVGFRAPRFGTIVLCIILGIILQPPLMILSGITAMFFTNYVDESLLVIYNMPLWMLLLSEAFIPAVVEEFLCRGVILGSYKGSRRPFLPILVSAVFFALMHGNFQQAIYAFVMGLILGAVALWSDSVFPGMVIHFVINATQIIYGRFEYLHPEKVDAFFSKIPIGEDLAYIGVSIISLPFIFLCMRGIFNKKRRLFVRKAPCDLSFGKMWPFYATIVVGLFYCFFMEYIYPIMLEMLAKMGMLG